LTSDGATRVIIAGHSMGANAAIIYGASRENVVGVISIAPGHVPDVQKIEFEFSLDEAKAMVVDGNAPKKVRSMLHPLTCQCNFTEPDPDGLVDSPFA